MSEQQSGASGPVIIKKYANRRLYNTQTSSYVTLDHLCEMVKNGVEFEVRDARTGDDITRQVLAQIIFDEENKGQHLLPIQFLRQLIRFYGDSLQALVPSYLEMSMESFAKHQAEMRDKFTDAITGKLSFKDYEAMARQNIQMFERAMRMFTPFGAAEMFTGGQAAGGPFAHPPEAGAEKGTRVNGVPEEKPQRDEEIKELKDQLAAMRAQINDLAQRK